ncbi:esterase/lipase family protein [Tsukamurella pseudospumae]|uniref:Alpha/beta hydrolase n=1 Tax=Tsukamurella pseudospumae TaxID=239498 RepID=A0A137ZTA0_9ACTN|nr:alpha/beta hydrolase [Tsukamurella pseudospumae]KXP01408.1 alpha/beta hydrolase [Tsukamurella pseudospumae]
MTTIETVRAPRRALMTTDYARALGEGGALSWSWPLLLRAPTGDGRPVLVLPGLGTSDLSTVVLRRTLRRLGYRVHGWKLGTNIGPSEKILRGMPERLRAIADAEGPVTLIGWSLGGIYARRLAREHPDLVRQVFTLGSPFRLAHHRQSNTRLVYETFGRWHAERLDLPLEPDGAPLGVPAVAIYSRLDGIVPWQLCRDPAPSAENIEVLGSHLGLGTNLAVLWALADRLATPPDGAPFRPPTALRFAYPRLPGA